jgi:hypothetical protein
MTGIWSPPTHENHSLSTQRGERVRVREVYFHGKIKVDVFVKNPNCHPERSERSLRKTKCIIIADG